MTFNLQAFANRVISQYLYGADTAPASLAPNDVQALINERRRKRALNLASKDQVAETGRVTISHSDFMAVSGRFATLR
jgi:hypothetical protein